MARKTIIQNHTKPTTTGFSARSMRLQTLAEFKQKAEELLKANPNVVRLRLTGSACTP